MTPTYRVLEESGPDHAKEFTVGVYLDHVLVFGGGVIPDKDVVTLKTQGVAEVFCPGSSLKAISHWLEQALDSREGN